MLKIKQSVGVGGQNRPEDVAVIQVYLKLISGPSASNGYYKGPVNGFCKAL